MLVGNIYVRWLETIGRDDLPHVGGKNANLGEMIRAFRTKRIAIPQGFAITSAAYREFLKDNSITDRIEPCLDLLERGDIRLDIAGKSILGDTTSTKSHEELARQVRLTRAA